MTFTLDKFQKDAIAHVDREHSVLVSAPTGAGKTVIADAAIKKAMAKRQTVIYTAPIKALSNQKYRDFRAAYGSEQVGILTGDVSINPDAPILIMTTEIYRNSLFENAKRIESLGWVVFDEVHYLDDVDRGTVWEEALLFTPPEVKILALSASVPNVHQLCDWIESIHGRPIHVIEESHRPVPLHFAFQCQGQFYENLKRLKIEGYMNRPDWRIQNRHHRQSRHKRSRFITPFRAKPNRLDQMLRRLTIHNLFPSIYFVFGRRRAESLAWDAAQADLLNDKERAEIKQKYTDLLDRYDLTNEKTAKDLGNLVELGIAYHHAGMLPTLKEVIEQLFTSRLIKLIFTTETFALGINMPARAVIFDELSKFYGTGFKNLTTRDFYQMAGRAGRRGMDKEGHVYIRVNPHDINHSEVERILYAKPELIRSQFNTAYATLLNLYRTSGRNLLELYPRTFHYYQSQKKSRKRAYSLIERKIDMLEEMGYLNKEGLTEKGDFASALFGYELFLAEIAHEKILEDQDEVSLNILLSSLIYEPRKGTRPPKLKPSYKGLIKTAEHFSRHIHTKESKYKVTPYTRPLHFHIAPAVEAWTRGETFDKLFALTDVDEGSLVRQLRMIIQLLRELLHAPHASEKLKDVASKARKLIDRGVVDAEKQLRV